MDVKQALKLHWKAKFMVICRQQGISLYSEDAEAELEKFVDDAVALFKRLGLFMNNSAGPTDEEVLAVSLLHFSSTFQMLTSTLLVF
jgi:hypothetical protein